jgi:PAS domain S-box-containing protein
MTAVISNRILEQLNTLILIVNELGNIEYVSPSAMRLLGYEPHTLLGQGWWDLTRKNKQERFVSKSEVMRILRDGKIIPSLSFERALTAADGSIRWILWNVSTGEDKTLLGIGHDITARKKVETQLLAKHKELEQKNTDILQSIGYAKRIQDAVIQDPLLLKNYFSDSFVLYKPRDVVSGDFYWYYKKGNKVFVAAIDCTGHGVPGAILSVIANGLIRDAVLKSGLETPGEILHFIDTELDKVLSKEDGSLAMADGMDVSLTVFDPEKKEVSFAGAFRPLVRVSSKGLEEFKGSRYPIGAYDAVGKKFENISIPWQSGDRFYLYSDGYADQFGGEREKKLSRKGFFELILSAQSMDMDEQKAFLEYSLNNWKQNGEQTDDILVIGLEV